MTPPVTVQFGEIFCRLEKGILPVDDFWTNWQWKLDPFCTVVPEERIQLSVGRDFEEAFFRSETKEGLPGKPLLLLEEERSGFFMKKVYRFSDQSLLWELIRDSTRECMLRFHVDASWGRITLLEDRTQSDGSMAFEYLAQMLPGVCLTQGCLTFHSALIEWEGCAFAVCAASGTGKTTHARLWRDCRNALILNGDRTICRPVDASWRAYGSPWSGTSGEQLNRSAPFRALVVLQRAEQNAARRLLPSEAFPLLFPHLLYPSWDRALAEKAFSLFDDLLHAVPVYLLSCRPDSEAVDVLYKELFR